MKVIASHIPNIKEITLVALFTATTIVGAFVRIPLPLVPFTLQSLFVLLSGAILGSKMGALSQGLYLFLGLVGLPVFAYGGGPGYVLQPTFGYLLGFIGGAYFIGKLQERFRYHCLWGILGVLLSGNLVIYFLGVSYLYLIKNLYLGHDFPFSQAIWWGGLVFIPGDLVKILVASIVIREIQRRLPLPIATSKSFSLR